MELCLVNLELLVQMELQEVVVQVVQMELQEVVVRVEQTELREVVEVVVLLVLPKI
jgi:hypothetical protein